MKSSTLLLRTFCCGLLFLLAAFTAQAQIIYITPNGAGNQNGSNWSNAAPGTQLQAKINGAASGSQVWVAAGTYKPNTFPAGCQNCGTEARNYTFQLKNNVAVYGGFSGSETALSQRNLSGNPTILSGNLGQANQTIDNCYHVVFAFFNDDTPVLDGFIIRDGNAYDINEYGNTDIKYDGKIYGISKSGGGGMEIERYSSPKISNCIFTENSANGGGGVEIVDGSAAQLTNCLFSGNYSTGAGGGVSVTTGSPVTLVNCTFFGNNALFDETHAIPKGGGALYISGTGSKATVTNCIMWGNSSGISDDQLSEVTFSLVQEGHAGTGNLNTDPLFVKSADPDGTDNIFGTADDGLKLQAGSPAINSGSNTAAAGISKDITGGVRIQGGTVDMGAYEFQCVPVTITAQPQNTSVCASGTATFTVAATGTNLTYKWKKGSTVLSTTAATLTLNNVQPPDAGTYTVEVMGSCGTVTSNAATLTVNPATAITSQPVSISKCDGDHVSFSVSATGTGLTYQWKKNGNNIGGATTASTYSISASTADAGDYSVVVSGSCGAPVTSNTFTLTVNLHPDATITASGPTTICPNGSVTLTSTPGASYKWSTNDITRSITVNKAGSYTVYVTSAGGCTSLSAPTVVTVADGQAPVVADLPTVNAECSVTVTPTNGTDNCAGTVVPTTTDPLTYTTQGTYTIHWTYSDGNGNSTIKEQAVVINDVTKPVADVVNLPALTGECGVAVTTRPTATDNCSGKVTATTTDPLSYNTQGNYTIHWSYDDGNGNTGIQVQSVIVKDVTKPAPNVVTLPSISGECSVSITNKPTATDNCAGPVTGTTADPLSYAAQGSYIVHWRFDDGNGNSSTQEQTVTVKDITKPAPDVTALPDVTGECGVSITSKPTATDNCSGKLTATTTDALSYNAQGTYTIRWTYDDGNGNTSTQTQNVVVKDVTKPVPNAATLPSVSGECSVSVNTPTATDNCAGIITGATADPLSYTAQGSYIIHWTYSDGNGNSTTQTQTVTVKDMTKPVPDAASLPDVTGECSVTITGKPMATDNCAGKITGSTTDALTYSSQGTYTVHWTYDDSNGNSSTQDQKVIIKDVTQPLITPPAAVSVSADAGKCSSSNVALGTPATSDNCAVASVTNNAPAVFPKGLTTVTWTVTDAAGNQATATQSVTVTDNEKPVITAYPVAPVTLCYNAGGTYDIASLQASDNCGVSSTTYVVTGATTRSGSGADASGAFNPGTSIIAWTVKDAAGNTATGQTTVVVNSALTVSIPDVQALSSGTGVNTVYPGYAPAATITLTAQVTGGSANYTYKWSTGANTPSITVSPTSEITYTITVLDARNCSSTGSKVVKVTEAICGNKGDKVSVCHGGNTLCIDKTSVPDHLAHGDYLGACQTNTATTKTAAAKLDVAIEETAFALTASPNPSTAFFALRLTGAQKEKVMLTVTDALGRVMETRAVTVGEAIQIGERYRAGIYFAVAARGRQRTAVKLIKQ